MKTIAYFFNEYIFIANCLMLMCYIQSNMLMLRLLFIAANLFFLIFSLTVPVINLDAVLFNVGFLVVNLTLSIPLVKNLIPPHFTKEQKEIYRNHFRNYLSPIETFVLFSFVRRKICRVSSTIEKMGNEFSSLYFVAKIGKNCKVNLQGKKKSFELNESSWVGIPEYLNLISRKDTLIKALKEFDTGEWGATLNVKVELPEESEEAGSFLSEEAEPHHDKHNISVHKFDKSEHTILFDEDNTVIIYEFDLRNIDKIFTKTDCGNNIMRGLHSIWLKYCSEVVKKVDIGNVEKSNPNTSALRKMKTLEDSVLRKNTLTFNKSTQDVLEPLTPVKGSTNMLSSLNPNFPLTKNTENK